VGLASHRIATTAVDQMPRGDNKQETTTKAQLLLRISLAQEAVGAVDSARELLARSSGLLELKLHREPFRFEPMPTSASCGSSAAPLWKNVVAQSE
jgi:hypothetical protein